MGAQFDWSTLAQFKLGGAFAPGQTAAVKTFWAGRDDVHGVLKALISSAQHSVVISGYGYDDDELDQIVREKLDSEKVFVQLSLDKSQAGGVHERQILANWNPADLTNSVAIGQSEHHAINHLKMVIVDGVYRVTGSTNWSTSGETLQNNELTVTSDPGLAAEARTVLDLQHQVMLRQMAASKAPK